MSDTHSDDPLRPHRHDPNPAPPTADPTFTLTTPGDSATSVNIATLQQLPLTRVADCYIVSTGHGTSGPFTFAGVRLLDLIMRYVDGEWSEVEVVSADGFGNRIFRRELEQADPAGPILLAYLLDGRPLSRQDGLVRLIVPSEKDDALRQVKWVERIKIVEQPLRAVN